LIARQIARHDQKIEPWLQQHARWIADGQTERLGRLQAQMAEYRARHHQRLARYLAHQHELESQIEAHQQEHTRVVQQLATLDPQAPFFNVDTETDQLITQFRIAVYNSTLHARECYFGSGYARATPLTLWRLFFSQDGYYRADETDIHITLKPFRHPHVQQAAREACELFNREQVKTVTGQVIQIAVTDCI
jgi:hypothetical protein